MANSVYLPIDDALKLIGARVNLFAVVAEAGEPRRSRGTDYVIILRIADQSYPDAVLPVNFFAETVEKLPQIRSTGDIISIHRVIIKLHNGKHYGAFHKRFSSFAIYEGRSTTDFSPYCFSTMYHATDHDKQLVLQIRKWSLTYHPHAGMKQLRDIYIGKVFDLVCKVVHVCGTHEDGYVLFVWDGTDTPPLRCESDLNAEGDNPCPLHPEAWSLSRETLCTLPCVGTIVMVIVGQCFIEISRLQGGVNWVKLCSILFKVQSGMWKGFLQSRSKICLLSDEDQNVVLNERNFTDRSQCKLQRQPMASFPQPSRFTETDYEDAAYATVMESLTHEEVTHKFKTLVRVIAAYPWQAEHFCSPVHRCYRIRLTLEDPTARIHAYLVDKEAVEFFGGYLPLDELASKMSKLLGLPSIAGREGCARDPPWVWCCIKSYYLNKSDPWRSRRYKIFGTKLVG